METSGRNDRNVQATRARWRHDAGMSNVRRRLNPHVTRELAAALRARRAGDVPAAWTSLERAHVLSQPSALLHTRVHVAMMVLAVRTRDLRELAGQLVRLAVAAIGSLLGRYPRGNTGRARVPINEAMVIPTDLAVLLQAATDSRPPAQEGERATG